MKFNLHIIFLQQTTLIKHSLTYVINVQKNLNLNHLDMLYFIYLSPILYQDQ